MYGVDRSKSIDRYGNGEDTEKPGESEDETIDGFELKEDGQTAIVSTRAGFTYATNQSSIEKIEIKKGFVLEESLNIGQDIEIVHGTNNLNIDFNNSNLSTISINGDNNTIKNANIKSLNIGESVENLTLDNIKDDGNSEHAFNGGGAESIKLLGNTTFKGNIKIQTGKDIQIRSESSDAKIEGNLWVESDVVVKIAAPISNVKQVRGDNLPSHKDTGYGPKFVERLA